MKTASDIEREAVTWIVRRDASNAARDVEQQFQAWIDADVRHRVAYLRLNAAWERTAIAEKLRPLQGAVDPNLLAPTRSAARRWFQPWLSAAAALIFVSIGIVGWFALNPHEAQVYSTGVGHFERVRLDDGSTVEINTDSEIRVRMTAERRLVSLVRGEAHFKVAHDRTRPFDVEAGGTRVRAVGTAFSVRLRDRRHAEVLVTEGRVAITAAEFGLKDIPVSMPTLAAGEFAAVEPEGIDIQPVQTDTIVRRLAWTEGKLVFDEDTLESAVAEFNRYNRQQLVIADPALETLRVGGSFEATDVPSFLDALQRVFGVQAKVVDGEAIRLVAAE